MRSKILILFLVACLKSFGQSVPNTTNFTLQDVVNAVGGTSLSQAFTNSNAAYFNATYGSKTMNPQTLYGFRDYKPTGVVMPTVTTTAISSITDVTASSGGNVTADGGATVTARGVCWNTSTSPTIANSKTTDGTGTGVFTSSLTSLTCGTTYYVRAYATNTAGTAYGNEVSFTTTGTPLYANLGVNDAQRPTLGLPIQLQLTDMGV